MSSGSSARRTQRRIRSLRFVAAAGSTVIAVLPIIIVCALGFRAFITLWHAWMPRLPEAVSQEATRLLGTSVSVARLTLAGSGLVAEDVTVADPIRPDGPLLAVARRISIGIPSDIVSRYRSESRPVIDVVDVRGGSLRVVRDADGRWNVAELIKPRKEVPTRAWIGRLTLSDISVGYHDHVLPHHQDRHNAPVAVSGVLRTGAVLLDDPASVAWSGNVGLSGDHEGRLHSTGRYDSARGAGLVSVQADGLAYPAWCNRFLPKTYAAERGRVAGSIALGWMPGTSGVRIQGRAVIEDALIATPWLRSRTYVRTGTVTFGDDHVGGRCEVVSGGIAASLNGRLDGFGEPQYAVELASSNVKLRDVLSEVIALRDYRNSLARIQGDGMVRATVTGRHGQAYLDAIASGRAAGAPEGGLVEVTRPARVVIAAWGPMDRLQILSETRASEVKVRGTVLRRVRLTAGMVGDRAAFGGTGALAGGAASLVGYVVIREPYRYACSMALRGADLAVIADNAARSLRSDTTPASGQFRPEEMKLAGRVSADVEVSGDGKQPLANVHARVQVLGGNLYTMDIDEASASARITAGTLALDSAIVRRGTAWASARGEMRLSDRTGYVEAEADDWPIPGIIAWTGGKPDLRLGGTVSLRDGRLDGDLRRPHLRGALIARGLEVDTWDIDYAVAAVEGTPDSVSVDGEIIRVPSVLTINGMVRRPFSGSPWITALAHARDLDIADVRQAAETELDVSGLAQADAMMHGPVAQFGSGEFSVEMDRLWAGDVTLDNIHLQGVSGRTREGIAVRVTDAVARLGTGILTGQAGIQTDGAFEVDLRGSSVPFDAVSSLTSGYADLGGMADVRIRAVGHRDRERQWHASGDLSLTTRALTVNGEDLGDLAARLALHDGALTGERSSNPAPALRWGNEGHALIVDSLRYDLESRQFDAHVRGDALPVQALRRAAERSPAVVSGGRTEGAARALAALAPLEGRVSLHGPVTITPEAWRAAVSVDGSGLSAGGFRADTLVGSVEAANDRIVLKNAELQTGDAVISAEGDLIVGDRIRGTVTAQGIDLSVLEQWLPADSPLRGLSGQVDTVTAEVSGRPDQPEVAMFLAARDVGLSSEGAARAQIPSIAVPAIRLSGATIREGEMGFDDLAVVLRGGAAASGPEQQRPVELHASGRIPFTWQSPFIEPDAVGEVTVRLPETELRSLLTLAAGGPVDMSGTTGGEISVRATRNDLEKLASGETDEQLPVEIRGDVWFKAELIRALNMRTALSNVDLRLQIADNRILIGPSIEGQPAARVMRFGPGSSTPVETGSIMIAGSLPIAKRGSDTERITISAPRIAFDEAPFPGFSTGRFAGVITGPSSGAATRDRTSLPAVVTISGTLLEPHISGNATLRSASMRLPVTEAPMRARRPVPAINPTFDLHLAVEGGAVVRSNQLSATLGTAAGQPIRLVGSLSDPRLAGTLAISAGTLTFPTARFTINRGGTVSLRYPGPSALGADQAGLDVSVDLTAQARITAESVTGRVRRYLVTVEARGPLMEPPDVAGTGEGRLKLTYRADPPDLALSNEGLSRRITALLGGQDALNAVFGNQSNAGGVLMGKVVDYLGGALMPDLVDQTGLGRALGLSEFSLDYSRAGAFVLRLSRDLPGPFEIGYWKHISGARMALSEVGDWELRLGARLQRRVRLTWTVNDQGTNVYRLEGVYSF